MPDFDEPVQIRDNGKVKAVLTSGALVIFTEHMGEGMFGGLADGMQVHSEEIFNIVKDKIRFRIDGNRGNIWLGGGGQGGDIILYPASVAGARVEDVQQSTILLQGQQGRIVFRSEGKETLTIDGADGDIVLANADCAEDFELEGGAEVEPGSVLVVGEAGRLRLADTPYDHRVAGVVSGAGGVRPGVVLGRCSAGGSAVPIGLAGRVFCKVDASEQPVDTGALLTTSSMPGHAMAAIDPGRAFGSVLGKALQPVARGQALIPILVSLQ